MADNGSGGFADSAERWVTPGDFRWPVRVYYEDTDAGGVVYHANYLRFMERARTERLRAHGFSLDDLHRDHGILFVIHGLELEFMRPARLNDLLWVSAEITERRAVSLVFRQAVGRGEGEILCRGKIRVVTVAADTMRPRPMPEFLTRGLGASPAG